MLGCLPARRGKGTWMGVAVFIPEERHAALEAYVNLHPILLGVKEDGLATHLIHYTARRSSWIYVDEIKAWETGFATPSKKTKSAPKRDGDLISTPCRRIMNPG